MNKTSDILLRTLRKVYPTKYSLDGQLNKDFTDRIDSSVSQLIKDRLSANTPLMISRLGSIELTCLVNYINQKPNILRYARFVTGKTKFYEWNNNTIKSMCMFAGFFPGSYSMLERFSELILEDMKEIDILGSWLKEEALFASQLSSATKVGLMNLEPYNHVDPWSMCLEGMKVLVIHPFTESISKQYEKRRLLFADKRVLPDFELKTLKAVQSISNNRTDYINWFDALQSMKEKVSAVDFDVAIIGCGAYGMPLAAHVKRLGKKAVHLGGATQILFGITGKRWETEYDYKDRLMNSHWIRPAENETPQDHTKVEDGCYW